MNTIPTRTTLVTGAVAAAIASAAVPALLFLGAGTAQAIQDVSERGAVAIIDNLPTPRMCGQCGGFNPQPDPPGNPDPGSSVLISDPEDKVGIGNPDIRPTRKPDPANSVGIVDPGSKVGLGGPDTSPPQHN